MEKRDCAVVVRLTKKEKDKLIEASRACSMKMEPFMRKLIEGSEIKTRPADIYISLIREINAIGNNINQIARVANTQKYVNKEQIESVVRYLDDIMEKVRDLE